VTRRRWLSSRPVLYAALLAALAIGWLIQPNVLLGLPFWLRFGGATLVWFAPIFIANLIFAQRFATVADSTTAFGANLLGAMVGGLIEYLALITGYQALAFVVAVLYGFALLASVALPATSRQVALRGLSLR
jgi:hypothetical protein